MPILGISIGTRRNGIAIIQNGELRIAQVHTFNERWSKQKLTAIIKLYNRYCKRYGIRVVVVKTPKASHFSLAIKHLLKALDMYMKKQRCLVQYTTIANIKKEVPSIKNKKMLREFIVLTYPCLQHEQYKDMRVKQPYYEKLFEATMAAHLQSKTENN